MKLRNKNTGVILEGLLTSYPVSGDVTIECMDENSETGYSIVARYKTLAELNEEWEDYGPKEPLIKDEKVRKAVRAWAEAVGDYPLCIYEDTGYEGDGRLKIYKKSGYPAVFDLGYRFYDLEIDMQYSIDELCGEDEE